MPVTMKKIKKICDFKINKTCILNYGTIIKKYVVGNDGQIYKTGKLIKSNLISNDDHKIDIKYFENIIVYKEHNYNYDEDFVLIFANNGEIEKSNLKKRIWTLDYENKIPNNIFLFKSENPFKYFYISPKTKIEIRTLNRVQEFLTFIDDEDEIFTFIKDSKAIYFPELFKYTIQKFDTIENDPFDFVKGIVDSNSKIIFYGKEICDYDSDESYQVCINSSNFREYDCVLPNSKNTFRERKLLFKKL